MNIATPTETTQLVTIPKETALSVFTTEKAMDPFLARIRAEIDGFVPDITTAAGRKAVASMAYKVAQSKSYLEGVGKALADEQKEIPKKIDACRKLVKETLDGWRDEVRKPLTDWEAAEESRVKVHTDAITVLNELARTAPGRDSAALKAALIQIDAVVIGPACEEFEGDYARAKDAARVTVTDELAKAETREAEAAELTRLREESAARTEAERIASIQREAAEAATREAEAAAQKKLDDAAAAIKDAEEKATASKKAAEETEARVRREADAAAAQAVADAARREANKRHCASINTKAKAAFIEGGMTEKQAALAVTLIAQKAIPNITISY